MIDDFILLTFIDRSIDQLASEIKNNFTQTSLIKRLFAVAKSRVMLTSSVESFLINRNVEKSRNRELI